MIANIQRIKLVNHNADKLEMNYSSNLFSLEGQGIRFSCIKDTGSSLEGDLIDFHQLPDVIKQEIDDKTKQLAKSVYELASVLDKARNSI